MTDLPLRDLAEGFGLSLALGLVLWLVLRVPPALAWGLMVFVAAIAHGWALRARDPVPDRWVVGIARTITFWCVGLPLMLLVPSRDFPPGVELLLFWLMAQGALGLGGTTLLRRRQHRAGTLLKLVSLLPYGFCVLECFSQPNTFGDWMAVLLGLSAVGLAAGLIAAAVTAPG